MDFAARLRKMEIQSASTIAVKSLEHLAAFSSKKGFGFAFDKECRRLLEARPTAVDLGNAIERVKKEKSREGIKKIILELKNSRDAAARNSRFLHGTILTHCHSTFVISALVANKEKIKEVIVTETRPRGQGITTAKELVKARMRVSLITDAAISAVIDRVDVVVVGADAIRKEGLVNKIGTHPLALVAYENKKPFYSVTSSFTIDRRKNIRMEQRPAAELRVSVRGAKIINPAFDITPWKYVSAVVTEKGVIKPRKLRW